LPDHAQWGWVNGNFEAPALGVLVLWFLFTGASGGLWVAALPLAFYSLLPVLRNTIVGLQQVDPSLVDAGRGIGMSASGVLWRVEFPLATPLILAGLRTSLVLAVGTAAFARGHRAVVRPQGVAMKRLLVLLLLLGALTNDQMIELCRQVDVEGRDAGEVARDWMVSKGFIRTD
jgi:hypothetical protein